MHSAPPPVKGARAFPFVHGALHALVDLATVGTIFSAIGFWLLDPMQAFQLVIAYDLLAFAGQVPLGALADWTPGGYRTMELAGLTLSLLGIAALLLSPWVALVLAALGNALFHVGAGALSLCVSPHRAWAAGVFVAPGALGLALGQRLGHQPGRLGWPLAVVAALLVVGIGVAWRSRIPAPARLRRLPAARVRWPAVVAGLILLSVFVRAFVGMAGAHGCPRSTTLTVALVSAAVLGKGLGGLLADRFGWLPLGVGALLLSAPLLWFGHANPYLVVPGLLLVQLTMPLTLVALVSLMPNRPGLAFGLPCLALVLGVLPTFFDSVRAYYHPAGFAGLLVLSAAALAAALWSQRRDLPLRYGTWLPTEGQDALGLDDARTAP